MLSLIYERGAFGQEAAAITGMVAATNYTASLGLLDIYFTELDLSNKIWRVGIPSFVGIFICRIVTI